MLSTRYPPSILYRQRRTPLLRTLLRCARFFVIAQDCKCFVFQCLFNGTGLDELHACYGACTVAYNAHLVRTIDSTVVDTASAYCARQLK